MKLVTGYLFLLPDTFGFPNEIFTFLLKKHLGKVEICFKSGFTLMPPVMPEPGGKQGAPQYLADQLTLFQPGRADYPHLLLLAPPMFFTFRHR